MLVCVNVCVDVCVRMCGCARTCACVRGWACMCVCEEKVMTIFVALFVKPDVQIQARQTDLLRVASTESIFVVIAELDVWLGQA